MLKKLIRLVLLFIVFTGIGFVYWSTQPISTNHAYEFAIQPGSSLRSATQQMVNAGVPLQPVLFELLARLTGQGGKLKAGSFEAEAGMTPLGLLNKIVRGEFAQFSFTVIEGWTFKQMRQAMQLNPNFQHDTAYLTDQEILSKLTQDYQQPEGLFFPDTYLAPKKSSDMVVYKQAFDQLQLRLMRAWQERDPKLSELKTPYDALILASIVEKETGLSTDRKMIAGVFINRLRKGMLLQTDPTVIYGMGEQYQGEIRKHDLLKDTPYNTYTRAGLPPTPIALVGMESIVAALHPARTDALFFVSRGDGSSHFSADLETHNRAVDKYISRR